MKVRIWEKGCPEEGADEVEIGEADLLRLTSALEDAVETFVAGTFEYSEDGKQDPVHVRVDGGEIRTFSIHVDYEPIFYVSEVPT